MRRDRDQRPPGNGGGAKWTALVDGAVEETRMGNPEARKPADREKKRKRAGVSSLQRRPGREHRRCAMGKAGSRMCTHCGGHARLALHDCDVLGGRDAEISLLCIVPCCPTAFDDAVRTRLMDNDTQMTPQ
eukprot:1194973-Prorocentrum_minimum.AAC.3